MDAPGLDIDWYVHRHRDESEVPHGIIHAGLHKDFLWQDWQDALAGYGIEDCRWTPCYDCGACTNMGSNTLSRHQLHPMVEAKARDRT